MGRPETDPTRIDWTTRQGRAAIPFQVIDGRPVNPCETTSVRYGRNELGHWGEALAADALVSASDRTGRRWIVMVERTDGHGWALPGGHVDPGETPLRAAARELAEETGLTVTGASWRTTAPRYVPDPRASDEAWMVTVLSAVDLGTIDRDQFPAVVGDDDARQAAWVRADTYRTLVTYLAETHDGQVFPAHVEMLKQNLRDREVGPTDLGSRVAIERARLQVALASHALGHWHEGSNGTGDKPYTAYAGETVTAIDAALRALHDARSALVTESRRDEDAAIKRIDELLARSRAARLDAAESPPSAQVPDPAPESDRKT